MDHVERRWAMRRPRARHRGFEVIDRYGFSRLYRTRRQARAVARMVRHARVRGPLRQAWPRGREDYSRYTELLERMGPA